MEGVEGDEDGGRRERRRIISCDIMEAELGRKRAEGTRGGQRKEREQERVTEAGSGIGEGEKK
ncbi:11936_t:CDS:2 [Funneliformis geosporum]|uniref:11936_t:CDS:1 n=1 Tax=Funneliformis geosporum TaxID=1117311 RepID=A0A9W4SH93_9GLOM|nr:11936_t:CDS:2 [Funneliformis geosporum]